MGLGIVPNLVVMDQAPKGRRRSSAEVGDVEQVSNLVVMDQAPKDASFGLGRAFRVSNLVVMDQAPKGPSARMPEDRVSNLVVMDQAPKDFGRCKLLFEGCLGRDLKTSNSTPGRHEVRLDSAFRAGVDIPNLDENLFLQRGYASQRIRHK